MRVAQVVNVRWHNATAWYGLALARLFRDAGHQAVVLGLPGTPPLAQAQAMGLPVAPLPLNDASPLALGRLWRDLNRFLDDFRPDVVDCHRGEAFVLWGLLRRLRPSFRLVRTRGDQRPPRNNLPNRWLHAHACDAVVATNSAMFRHCRDRLRVPAPLLRLNLGGVDRRRFAFDATGRERVRAEFGVVPGETVVGLLGRFDRVKGQRELIQAVSLLRRQGRPVRLLLIGFETATAQSEVEAWLREFDVADAAAITGRRADVAACLSALDVGVVASLWSEAIARAALEIMSCGVPLLSTRVGVMPDLVSEAALVPPGDPAALAALLDRCMADPAFPAALRAEQAQTMADLSDERFYGRALDLYQSLLA